MTTASPSLHETAIVSLTLPTALADQGRPCRRPPKPATLAASTAGSTPRTGRTRPSNANSPSTTAVSS